MALIVGKLFAQGTEFPLWPNGAPKSNQISENENLLKGGRIANISEATLTVLLPVQKKLPDDSFLALQL